MNNVDIVESKCNMSNVMMIAVVVTEVHKNILRVHECRVVDLSMCGWVRGCAHALQAAWGFVRELVSRFMDR